MGGLTRGKSSRVFDEHIAMRDAKCSIVFSTAWIGGGRIEPSVFLDQSRMRRIIDVSYGLIFDNEGCLFRMSYP